MGVILLRGIGGARLTVKVMELIPKRNENQKRNAITAA
jgi:hypothetical protein